MKSSWISAVILCTDSCSEIKINRWPQEWGQMHKLACQNRPLFTQNKNDQNVPKIGFKGFMLLEIIYLSVSQPIRHSRHPCWQHFGHSWKLLEWERKWEDRGSFDKMFSHYPSFIFLPTCIPPSPPSSSSPILPFILLYFPNPSLCLSPPSGFVFIFLFFCTFVSSLLLLGRGRVESYHGNSKLATSYLFAGFTERGRAKEKQSVVFHSVFIFLILSQSHEKSKRLGWIDPINDSKMWHLSPLCHRAPLLSKIAQEDITEAHCCIGWLHLH